MLTRLRSRVRRNFSQAVARQVVDAERTPSSPGGLQELAAYVTELEQACFDSARARCHRLHGKVYAGDDNFRREYSQKTIKITGILFQKQIDPADVDSAIEELSESACAYKEEALRRLQVKVEQADSQLSRCRRCQSSKVSYIPLQARSTDEGMAYLYTCSQCHKTWRQ
jgi:DNA-directed RNA polymerase subunit M/transcription elongation factor TFIIS